MPSVTLPIQDIDAAEESGTQSVKAQQRLRELILAGHLPAGSRIAELALVERFEPSITKTPVRGKPQRSPSASISCFSSPSGIGVNLLKSGMIKEGAR